MKLDISREELAFLLHNLQYLSWHNREAFMVISAEHNIEANAVVASWMANTLENYSLCALNVDEFIEEVNQGQRCNPVQAVN